MTKRIVLILVVLATMFTTATTVATADPGLTPDGIWEMNDGADWIRFYERFGQKQVQWHSDNYGPCNNGPATSSSANWSYDNGGIHVRIWARCDSARIRLQPIDKWFAWNWNMDLIDQDQGEWTNYLYHRSNPDCIDTETGQVFQADVDAFALVLLFAIPEPLIFAFTSGQQLDDIVLEVECSYVGCEAFHLRFQIKNPPPSFDTYEFRGSDIACRSIECVWMGTSVIPQTARADGYFVVPCEIPV